MLDSVSTYTLFAVPRNAVAGLQSDIAKAETEATTGTLANPVESLGSEIGFDEVLRTQADSLTNLQSTNTIAQVKLTASQNALSSITADAQNFVDALVSAKSSGNVSSLQQQAQGFLSSLASSLNTTSAGAYVFGGTNSTAKPIADYSQGPQAATAAAFQAAFGFSQSSPQVSTIPAASLRSFLTGPFANLFAPSAWSTNWSQASNAATSAIISGNQSVVTSVSANSDAFRTLANAYTSIADLGIDNLNPSAQQAAISNALSQASTAQQGISDLASELGISQSQITDANSKLQTQTTLINNQISQLDGVNQYQAATQLSDLTSQLEAAYSLTDRISKLSLVNYLAAV
jgi:flagellar hook-associated protein 3 FlgL